MNALILGLGSMGRRRIRCLRHHGVKSIAGFDPREDRRNAATLEYGIDLLQSISKADVSAFDLIIVSTPPDCHHGYIAWAIEARRPCFVEASVIREPLPKLLSLATQHNVLVAPSCTMRFHPAVRDVAAIVQSGRYGKVCNFSYHCGQYLPDWHPWENVKEYYVSKPETGGAREIVAFELTWLIDIMGWPRSIAGLRMRTTDVGAPIDDTYAGLLQFENFVGSFIVDVVARQALRRLTINLEKASLYWDWTSGIVHVYEGVGKRTVEFHQPMPDAHAGYLQSISEAMYVDEIGCFIAAASGGKQFPNNLRDDIRVLELLESLEKGSG
jgi:predicted dehydrogenase